MVSALRNSVDPVAAQQEAVVQRQRLAGVIQPYLGLNTERTGQNVRPASAIVAHVVGGQTAEAVAAQPIGAGIADVQSVRDAAAEHQCGEGASHSRQLGVALSLGMDPTIQRVEDPRASPAHFHGFRQIAKSIQKAAHRGLGRHTPAFRAADPIGDRSDNVAAGFAAARSRKRRRRNPRCCLRGPVPEANPALALTPEMPLSHRHGPDPGGAAGSPAGDAAMGAQICKTANAASMLRPAMIIEEIAAGA